MKISLLFCFFALAHAKFEEYTGWKSYFIKPITESHLKTLGGLSGPYSLDFWVKPTISREGIVFVKPEHQEAFLKALDDNDIAHRIHVDNVKAQLEYEDFLIEDKRNSSRARNVKELPYDNYQSVEAINAYLADIAQRYPDKVKLVIPANSFEGRPIHYLKISTTNFEDQSKPVIFIDAGIHAREWVAPPTVTWAIKKLVEDVTEPDLLERFDWILLPVVNPDGYEFSIRQQPMWRMTRSTDSHPDSVRCPGVDGNRNYDFFWGQVSTSHHPCGTEQYGGARAFSEIETRVVRDILHEHLHRMALYITVHSFGSMILYPWGHDGSLSNNALALHLVGVNMAEEIDRHSPSYFWRYVVGNAALVLWYGASGASEDYAHSIGVPLSYTYELPGHWDGFHLRPSYIEQVCRETWEGFVVGARMAGDLYVGRLKV